MKIGQASIHSPNLSFSLLLIFFIITTSSMTEQISTIRILTCKSCYKSPTSHLRLSYSSIGAGFHVI
ncbi:hypothetical protein D3C77_275030 [compost metagenome]